MIKIKFQANSVAELRTLIAEYLGVAVPANLPAKTEKKDKISKQTETVQEPEPPSNQTELNITIEDIRTLVLSGDIPKAKVKGLLGNFGVERITDVPENDIPAFYAQLSALK